MNRERFYSINNSGVQFWLGNISGSNLQKDYTTTLTKEELEDKLEKVSRKLNTKSMNASVFPGIVLWVINCKYVIDERYFLMAYDLLMEKLIKEIKILNHGSIDRRDNVLSPAQRALKIAVIKEELGIIKYVVDTKLPYPDKMPLKWDDLQQMALVNPGGQPINFFEQVRIRVHRNPVPENFNPGVPVIYGRGFDEEELIGE